MVKVMKETVNSAVIAAGGSGLRMGGEIPKQFIKICGIPVIIRTLLKFEECDAVDETVIVARNEDVDIIKRLASEYGVKKISDIVPGGATRQESVLNGIKAANGKYVFIHDAARPFVTREQINKVIEQTHRCGAAALGVTVKDTLKTVDGGGMIINTVSREDKYCIQTPQGFEKSFLINAHTKALNDGLSVTDDCALAEYMGKPIKVIDGSSLNIKITTPEDILIGEGILKSEKKESGIMRVGSGYDVHKLTENRKLIIGGVEIPYELGLLGHSDADVLLHAVMDAMLGAAALGDIGKHFPDTDEEWRGADSRKLLTAVAELIKKERFEVVNIDATVVAQRPKLLAYIPKMREEISKAAGVAKDCINVKATTTEKLGFCGRGEGIAAEAVCMLKKID